MSNRKPARKAMPFHEVTSIFPPMGDEEFKALTEDIRANGQREAIWTHEGKIIDGRNRYSAILRLQEQKHPIEPEFREWDGKGSLVAFVVSLNLHRRHLSESQRAMIAAELATQAKGRPKKNSSIEPFSQARAAEALKVSVPSVKRAKQVIEHGDAGLISAVRTGEVPVSTAAKAVEAVERYPELARVASRPQDRAAIAENLDKLPEPEREEKIQKAIKGDSDTLAALANKPPMPKKRPPSAEDVWRDFFDDTGRALTVLSANGGVESAVRGWEYDARQWFLGRLKDLILTLNDVEDLALRSMDYDTGAEGAVSEATVH